jgi:hypothetical protein
MSVHDSTHFPPGTHMLDDRMSLAKSTLSLICKVSDFDTETSNGSDKQQVVLNPTPSDDPDDPLVGQKKLQPRP